MKKFYSSFAVAIVSLMSLASCSRSDYAFKPGAGSYHTNHAVAVAPVEAQPTVAKEAVAAQAATVEPVAPAAVVASHQSTRHVAATGAVAKVNKPSLAQQVVIAKVAKQLHKKSETAGVSQTQSKAGRAAIVALIGLVLLLVGGAAGVGLIALLGLIALIVGVVMLIAALING